MSTRPAFLFDLDATLIDSAGDIADAVNTARSHFGLAPLTDDEVERQTGQGSGYLLEQTLPPSVHGQMSRIREIFFSHYRDNCLVRTRSYPGAEACLDALGHHPLGIVTNKPGMLTDRILEELGWTERFGVVVAGDTLPQRKPAPEPLLAALETLGVRPREAVFVGDTAIDRDTAAAANVHFVAVSWGRVAGSVERTVDRLDDLPFRHGWRPTE